MNAEQKRQLAMIRDRLNMALDKFEDCPDRLRAWELDLGNAVGFAIEDIEKIANIPEDKNHKYKL